MKSWKLSSALKKGGWERDDSVLDKVKGKGVDTEVSPGSGALKKTIKQPIWCPVECFTMATVPLRS